MHTVTPLRIRLSDVCTLLGVSRTGLDRLLVKDPTFPSPIKTGNSRQSPVFFDYQQIQHWHQSKLKAQSTGA